MLRQGVTIPSQIRYVEYFSRSVDGGGIPEPAVVVLNRIRMHTTPNFDPTGGCGELLIAEIKYFQVFSRLSSAVLRSLLRRPEISRGVLQAVPEALRHESTRQSICLLFSWAGSKHTRIRRSPTVYHTTKTRLPLT
eukprot:COSAG05_NODE_3377_length_2100_cov_10.836744_2_plen_136_part_00